MITYNPTNWIIGYYLPGTTLSHLNICLGNYDVKAYGDEAEFSRYNFPSKGTTVKAPSGGWVIYSEPNFQGKVLYQIGSKFAIIKLMLQRVLQGVIC